MVIILLTLIAIAFIVFAIVKEIDIQISLLVAGLFLFIAALLMGVDIMKGAQGGVKDTGYSLFNLISILKGLFSATAAGLGLNVMAVGGFSAMMFGIGASGALVNVSAKAFSGIKSPYILLVAFFFLNQFLGMVITSATGLALLLMATEYRMLRGLGISQYSAAGVIATSSCLEFGPLQTPTIVASKIANTTAVEYFLSDRLPIILVVVPVIAIAHYYWQKRSDVMDKYDASKDKLEDLKGDNQEEVFKAPAFYALLPFIPLVLIFIFNSYSAKYLGFENPYDINIVVAILVSVLISAIVHTIYTGLKSGLASYSFFVDGMSKVWGVVALVVVAGFFAEGIMKIGALDIIIKGVGDLGYGGGAMTLIFSVITFIISAVVGSGNSAFLAFSQMVPTIAQQFNMDPAHMIVPVQFASSLGRTVSPLAGFMIATASLAKIHPKQLVKRTSVPIFAGTIVMMVAHAVFNTFS